MVKAPKVPKMSDMLWAEYQKNALSKPCRLCHLGSWAVWAIWAVWIIRNAISWAVELIFSITFHCPIVTLVYSAIALLLV